MRHMTRHFPVFLHLALHRVMRSGQDAIFWWLGMFLFGPSREVDVRSKIDTVVHTTRSPVVSLASYCS
jgi:hypothetical protein